MEKKSWHRRHLRRGERNMRWTERLLEIWNMKFLLSPLFPQLAFFLLFLFSFSSLFFLLFFPHPQSLKHIKSLKQTNKQTKHAIQWKEKMIKVSITGFAVCSPPHTLTHTSPVFEKKKGFLCRAALSPFPSPSPSPFPPTPRLELPMGH